VTSCDASYLDNKGEPGHQEAYVELKDLIDLLLGDVINVQNLQEGSLDYLNVIIVSNDVLDLVSSDMCQLSESCIVQVKRSHRQSLKTRDLYMS